MYDKLEKLEAELEIEKAKLKALQDQINPPPRPQYDPPPRDYTEGMSMPRSAMQAMNRWVPQSLMAELVLMLASQIQSQATHPRNQQPKFNGVAAGSMSDRFEPPGGKSTIDHCDSLVDEQDRLDKIALAEKLAAAEVAMKAAKGEGNDNK